MSKKLSPVLGSTTQDQQLDETRQRAHSLEACKLIADWSKWLAAIETGAIAGIGAVLKFPESKVLAGWQSIVLVVAHVFAGIAVACFVASICAAMMLLLSLPSIVQNLARMDTVALSEDIGAKSDGYFKKSLNQLCSAQWDRFVGGIVCFVIFLICYLAATAVPVSSSANQGNNTKTTITLSS